MGSIITVQAAPLGPMTPASSVTNLTSLTWPLTRSMMLFSASASTFIVMSPPAPCPCASRPLCLPLSLSEMLWTCSPASLRIDSQFTITLYRGALASSVSILLLLSRSGERRQETRLEYRQVGQVHDEAGGDVGH